MDVDNVVDDDKERERREREWDWRGRESDGETQCTGLRWLMVLLYCTVSYSEWGNMECLGSGYVGCMFSVLGECRDAYLASLVRRDR